MKAKKYIEVISSRLVPLFHEWFGGNPCIFQQDSALYHTATKVHDWKKKNHFNLQPWPGNLPDINPIRSLWDILKDEIPEVSITDKT